MSDTPTDPVEAEILRQLEVSTAASISPSDVAQALAPGEGWQSHLPAVRRAAQTLARAGRIDILRHGKPADPATPVRGVIRLRLRPAQADASGPAEAPGDSVA